ncbi:nuclear transport factor 2 family protein [Stenotrophomonas sp. 24(2023)]|uniref:nuclear transport factor 2 family protein n=1 Tax=Stenotrophomonas sp. 24(2023) TaxID=3068324 RepID=UPI0027DF021F|nr:nuclear transport factor 2 family protein [Stenotrophomonas sp. 24(2023)]WMJ68047.1 nuclear transport factor 2 family protein [Stenotrophomonas sp. 24(2023)]
MSPGGHAAAPALAAELERLERALHSPQVRADPVRLGALLDADFHEIASSGRCVDRAAVLDALAQAGGPVVLEADDFAVWVLAEGLAQVRYRSRYHIDGQPQRWVWRSSLWRRHGAGWRMAFHQGTPAA